MSDIEQRIRERAYELWRQAGRPDGRSDEFWFAARREFEGETTDLDGEAQTLDPPLEEPPVDALQHGAPAGMPEARIAGRGAIDERLEEPVEESASLVARKPVDD